MVDMDLLVQALRGRGHSVGNIIKVPANAGDYELTVDGERLTLEQARDLLTSDQEA